MSGSPRPLLVVGLGTEVHGDDGAGLEMARRIGPLAGDDVEVADEASSPLDAETFRGREEIVFLDAFCGEAPPGTIWIARSGSNAIRGLLPAGGGAHRLSAWDHLQMAGALGIRLPAVFVIGVQPKSLEPGFALSLPVEEAVRYVAGHLGELLEIARGLESRPALLLPPRSRAA